VGGHCRDCAIHHPEATQSWARIDERAKRALAVAVACCLAICAVGTVALNIGTAITWLIGIALVLSVLAVIWCVLSRGIFFISCDQRASLGMVGPAGRGIAWRDRVGTDEHPVHLGRAADAGSVLMYPRDWDGHCP